MKKNDQCAERRVVFINPDVVKVPRMHHVASQQACGVSDSAILECFKLLNDTLIGVHCKTKHKTKRITHVVYLKNKHALFLNMTSANAKVNGGSH